MSTTTPKTIIPDEVVFNTGTTRKDLLENLDTLLALIKEKERRDKVHEALDSQKRRLRKKLEQLNTEAEIRDPMEVAKAAETRTAKRPVSEPKKRGSFLSRLFGGGTQADGANTGYNEAPQKVDFLQQEQDRVAKVKQQIVEVQQETADLRAKAYAASSAVLDCYTLVTEWREKLDLQKPSTDTIQEYRGYIACMRADTLEEAKTIAGQEFSRKAKLALLRMEAKRKGVFREAAQAEAMATLIAKGASVARAQQTVDDARAQANEEARKAHNAALVEDYKWHEMAGDIADMEAYGLMKLLDWEL